MSNVAATMTVLQFGDSFFPSGAVSFSWGLEGLTESGVVADAAAVRSFVIGQLHARWAQFDRAVVVAAHGAMMSLEGVAGIDDQVEIQTPSSELRSGSRRMGEAMLSVFARLGIGDADTYRGMIKQGLAQGHLAPMQGLLWGRAGLSERDAVALSAHTFCTGLLGAGIRLGCLTHIDAQRILTEARGEAASLAELPVPPLTELSSYGVEAEIAVMQHVHNHTRVFAN
ncbi:MAG: urease accessory UreF family protein [Methyloceanibacter sp.]|jgi:urease accessory protein